MATETVSGTYDDNHHSFNVPKPVNASSPDPGYDLSKKIQQFPKHDTVELNDRNFLLQKQQTLLILDGYGLHEFVLGTANIPPQSIVDQNGNLVANPTFSFHKQQDKLLASWLFSTISDDILVYLTEAQSSFDVWTTVVRRFAIKSALTIYALRHSLYSQKKGQLSIKEYFSNIKGLYDTLMAVGNAIPEQEQASISLVGLSVEYESIHIMASTMNISLDRLTDMMADCETR